MAKQNVYISLVGKDQISSTLKRVNKGLKSLRAGAATVGRAFIKVGAIAVSAAAAIAGGIIAATKAAADEEKGMIRLTKAVEANSKSMVDMAKVEEQVAAQQEKLAFSDGEIRDSLAALMPFTKGAAKAFQIQAVAADLARVKNMSLEEASTTVARAMNGNTRATKQLGIELPKTAKKADILAAIQGKVAGQAEAYANSTEGQFTSLKNSFDDIVETLGAEFLPIAGDVAKWAKKDLLPAIQAALPQIIAFGKGFISAAAGIGDKVIPVIQSVANFVITELVPRFQEFAKTLFGPGGVAESVMGVVGPIVKDLQPVIGKLMESIGNLIGTVIELVGWLWGDGKGPLAIAVQGIGGFLGIFGSVLGTIADVISVVIRGVMDLTKAIADSPVGQLVGGIAGFVGDLFGGKRANGGPVRNGQAYLVGERGPEIFAPGASGMILPNRLLTAPAVAQSAGSGAGALSGRDLRRAMEGMTIVLDGERVGKAVDARLARNIRTTKTSSRLG